MFNSYHYLVMVKIKQINLKVGQNEHETKREAVMRGVYKLTISCVRCLIAPHESFISGTRQFAFYRFDSQKTGAA